MYFYIRDRKIDFDNETKKISYNGMEWSPVIRTFEEMKSLYQDGVEYDDSFGLYFMYRGVYFQESDKTLYEAEKLRFDITILSCDGLEGEYNKTFGHYHTKNPEGKYYEEIYQVISGEAIYLQQNQEKVFYTKAQKGDAVIMKSGFGHVTINPSNVDFLVMTNIVSSEFQSVYTEYSVKKGANYYLKKNGWEINPNYQNNLVLENIDEKTNGFSLYDNFLKTPEKYNFLK